MAGPERAIFPRGAGRASGGLELRCAVFARRDGRILLVRHRRHPLFGGDWTLPGGLLEYGVNPRESAARLLADQAGVEADSMRLLGMNSTVEGDWILTFVFEAPIRENPSPGRETTDARLFDLDALPAAVHPLTRRLLDGYRLTEKAKAV